MVGTSQWIMEQKTPYSWYSNNSNTLVDRIIQWAGGRAPTLDDTLSSPGSIDDSEFNPEYYKKMPLLWGEDTYDRHADIVEKLFNRFCFLAGTRIDMWPLEVQPGPDGVYDEAEVRAKVWQKPIEEIAPSDWVVSFDDQGRLKPGKVTRTMQNESKIILDFHGTLVTPGHAYWCAGGKYEGRFAPLIDILRDDGVVQHQDGTLIRAATGCQVGSADDEEFWAFTLITDDQGNERVGDRTKLRFGTRWMTPNGNHFSMREYMDGIGVEIIRDGPQKGYARWKETGIISVFAWTLSDTLPRPEDFVLERSGTSLEEIYKASQWEAVRPTMPPPMVMEGGPVQPLSEGGLKRMPRNETLAFSGAPSGQLQYDSTPQMNRRQRKAAEAKARQAPRNRRPKGTMLH